MLTLMLMLAVGQAPKQEPAAPRSAATAEDALRRFFVAMLTKDEATLKAVTLPTDDFAWLMKGDGPPKFMAPFIAKQFADKPIRALKVGDEVPIGKDRKLVVTEDEIGPDKAFLLPEGDPLPHRCRRVDGVWKVDARPIIAARKAAAAARAKTEGKAGGS